MVRAQGLAKFGARLKSPREANTALAPCGLNVKKVRGGSGSWQFYGWKGTLAVHRLQTHRWTEMEVLAVAAAWLAGDGLIDTVVRLAALKCSELPPHMHAQNIGSVSHLCTVLGMQHYTNLLMHAAQTSPTRSCESGGSSCTCVTGAARTGARGAPANAEDSAHGKLLFAPMPSKCPVRLVGNNSLLHLWCSCLLPLQL
jgi:hypothetical protein